MKEVRELIQSKLEEIQDIETISAIPDDLMEDGKIYFTYSLQKFFINRDEDRNYSYRIVLSGFIKLKDSSDVDTLNMVDEAGDKILNKLKEINLTCNMFDVTEVDSSIRKSKITGSVKYNEINKWLV